MQIFSLYGNFRNFINDSPILKNTSITLALRISGAGLLFVFNLLIVRFLGLESSGVLFLALTVVNILSTVFLFGVDQYILRTIAGEERVHYKKHYFKQGLILVSVVSAVGSIITMAASGALASIFHSPQLKDTIVILGFSLPFLTILTYLGYMMQAQKKFAKAVFILTNCLYLLSAFIIIMLKISHLVSLSYISAAITVATIISFVISYAIAAKEYNFEKLDQLGSTPSISQRDIALNSSHLFLVSIITLGLGWVDVLIVGYFLPEASVSIYSVASKLAKLLTFVLFAINIVVAPSVSKYFKSNDKNKLNEVLQKSTILSIVFCTPLLLLFLLLPNLFLSIFGHDYIKGVEAFRLLCVGQAINALTGAVLIVMTMVGLEKKMNLLSSLSLVAVIILGIILTPRYGINGMAFSTMIGLALVNMSGVYYLKKYHSIQILPTKSYIKKLIIPHAKNSPSR
jgi:O-antigen/teichoic acid export membrane protein